MKTYGVVFCAITFSMRMISYLFVFLLISMWMISYLFVFLQYADDKLFVCFPSN